MSIVQFTPAPATTPQPGQQPATTAPQPTPERRQFNNIAAPQQSAALINPDQLAAGMPRTPAVVMAENLLRMGTAPEKVFAALKAEGVLAADDNRSAAQIEHDVRAGFGLASPIREPGAYTFDVPPGSHDGEAVTAFKQGAAAAFSEMAMQPAAARSLMSKLTETWSFIERLPTDGARNDFYDRQRQLLARDFPGDKLDEAKKAINHLLDAAPAGNNVAAMLKEHYPVNHFLFHKLVQHARFIDNWLSTRPKS